MSDDYDGLYMAKPSFDDEFSIGETYGTRQEAIDGYVDEFGEPDGAGFETARLRFERVLPALPYGASSMIEEVVERYYHEWWDGALEDFERRASQHEAELDVLLQSVWESWCQRHGLVFKGYRADDVEHHVVGEDESDEELARRRKEEEEAEPAGAFVAWPADQPERFNACTDPCDMWTGPCACGAWHKEGR